MTDAAKLELPNPGDRLVDRYTILERVSLGGFGAVYRAMQDNLGREIALKVLLPDVVNNNADYVEQFRQEALLTSQLRHPNTITIFDYGQTETGLLFLVMEWLDGKTLTDVLKDEGALSYDRCVHISNQILKSLSEAHERGMVHRDLKPSNIMLCVQYGEPDFVKVLDFGLVKNLSDETLSIQGKAVEAPKFTAKKRAPGTPHYMAPEQAMGKGTNTSADIYSFGLILHEMLTGKRAVDGTEKMEVLLKQVRQPVPPLPEEFRDTFLGHIVARCVEKDPLKRPQNAGVLLKDYQRNEENRGIEINKADLEAPKIKSGSESQPVPTAAVMPDIFVGRLDELDEFNSIIQKGLDESVGRIISVTGQTGIGKTSLIKQFSTIFTEKTNGELISASYMPQGYLSFSAIRVALRNFFNIKSSDVSEAQIEIRRALSKYEITDSWLISFMTQFVVGKYGQIGEEREHAATRLEEFFDTLTKVTPVMFSVENIHWADIDSLNLLWKLSLAAVNKSRTFILVCSYRSQNYHTNHELQMFIERLNRLDHIYYREMQLAWLNKKDCAAIIESIVKMQRPMANQCMALSKGNPLFLKLVLQYILDEKYNDGADAQKLVIPNTIEKIAIKRIEQIVRKYDHAEYREILRRSALMGEIFSFSSVESLMQREGQFNLLEMTQKALEIWQNEGVLRHQANNVYFEFVHPYIVEFFNIDSSPELHQDVAVTKEALSANDIYIDLENIAYHFKLAGDRAHAIRYLEFAANAALQNSNLLKARKLYEEMLPLFNENTSLDEKKKVYHQLGELTLRLSEFGPSRDYFNMVVSLAQTTDDHQLEGLAYCGIADLALAQNQIEIASSNYNRAKNVLHDDDPNVQCKLLLGMGKLSKLKADWQAALSCFQKAYEHSSNAANFDLMGNALYELGVIYLALGSVRQAHECFISAQKNYQIVNNTADEASVLLGLAKTWIIFANPTEAHNANEAAIEIYQKLGDQLGFAYALAQMGSFNLNQLNYDEAQKFVLRSMPIFKEFHDATGIAKCQSLLATIELSHGQIDNAITLSNQALSQYLKTDDFGAQVRLYTMLGEFATYLENETDSQNNFSQAEMLLDVHQSNANRPELYIQYGFLAETHGDFASAENYYKMAQNIAQQAEYIEQLYIARLNTIKINVYFNPGRWYYKEINNIINESKKFRMKHAHLYSLLCMVWFEGVYGEQQTWEALMNELTRFVQSHKLPLTGFLRIFDCKSEVLRYTTPETSNALLRSASWIHQCLQQPAAK